jgi:8-oxo-dGTP pyrophosphatase MutT (NUDIX family)
MDACGAAKNSKEQMEHFMFSGKDKIKVKALCLFQDEGEIFVSKSYDTVKKDYFYRPIGGTTEFCEYTIDTIKREILEEMKAEIKNVTLEKIWESIFVCDGIHGHEIVFLYRADFVDKKNYERKKYTIIESNGAQVEASWIRIKEFEERKLRLVPEALLEYLKIKE